MTGIKKRLGSLLGPQGLPGEAGATPEFVEGTTTHVSPSEPAKIELTQTGETQYRIDAQVPRGLDGDPTAVANFGETLAVEISTPGRVGRNALISQVLEELRDVPVQIFIGATLGSPRPDTERPVHWLAFGRPVNMEPGDTFALLEAPEWTPQLLNLVGWYDAQEINLQNGSFVDLIPDQTAHARHLAVSGEGSITLVDNGINGNRALNFPSNAWATSPVYGVQDGPLTVFMVASVAASTSTQTFFDGGSATGRHAIYRRNENSWEAHAQSVSTALKTPVNSADEDPHLFTVIFDGPESMLSVSGLEPVYGDLGSHVIDSHRVGASNTASNATEMVLGELIVAKNVTESDRTAAVAYLTEKWGL